MESYEFSYTQIENGLKLDKYYIPVEVINELKRLLGKRKEEIRVLLGKRDREEIVFNKVVKPVRYISTENTITFDWYGTRERYGEHVLAIAHTHPHGLPPSELDKKTFKSCYGAKLMLTLTQDRVYVLKKKR